VRRSVRSYNGLVDRQIIWRDIDAFVKSRSAAAAIRVDAVAATDSAVVALDEYGLVFRSIRFRASQQIASGRV
jgi:hypothetical protein